MQRRKVDVVRACVLVCTFSFWIASYCWVGVPASGAGVSGQTAASAGARRIAAKMGNALVGGALARFAINGGLTAVRKSVG